ncbi:MAG TPA: COR domain-containing protein [Abditibacteriaceae bacterium]
MRKPISNLKEASMSVEELIEKARQEKSKELYLSDSRLTTLPESIGQLTDLESLYLSSNQLTELPDSLCQLKQLRGLYLAYNHIATLPQEIGQLAKLESLDLSRNALTTCPDSLVQLSQLKSLHLYDNQLTWLPDNIDQLAELVSLFVFRNQLTKLPESLGNLSKLTTLFISDNQLTKLPESFGNLSRLGILYMARNLVRSLPESIGQLTYLESLNISANQLANLPESIGHLNRLQDLDLSDNQFTTLPEGMRRLVQLETLDLSDNQISQLPEWLSQLPRLSKLYLHGNELLRLPSEILGPTRIEIAQRSLSTSSRKLKATLPPADILAFYSRSQANMRPLNEAKLILLGRGFAGKTSLVNRLVHDVFQPEQKTEGIKITEWDFSLFKQEQVRLNVWDFGGQEIMHATHQFFLTQRSLYLIVINGREGGEDADADYWLKLVESFGGDSPVIVVLNKIKEHPFSVNEDGLKRKFPNIREVIKTDCLDGTGIEELRRAIERETDRLPHLRDAFPSSWFAIKEDLATTKKNFLSFTGYRRKCSRLGEKDAVWQKQLASYLHRLGIALNFSDDPRLNDTHVLNPHWVTNGIYKILNSQLLEEQKGEISLGDIARILDPKEYPASMHRFLIDLMKKFDLCFSYTDDECHYLIPDLLDKQEPPQVKEFDAALCLNFQYHYPVALEGLLPRFIVRSHEHINPKGRWRSGAILRFEGCRALVRADMQERKVFVSVDGPMSRRNRLLAVIRSQFESIHQSFKNLDVQELVPIPQFPDETVLYEELRVFEENRVDTFPKVVNGKMQMISVEQLLNGVDLEGSRRREDLMDKHLAPTSVFISYSHKDESLREELETHLSIMRRQSIIDVWHDRKIGAGEEWKNQIDVNLEKADIILLLISSDFIASDYCYDREMMRAMERHDKGEAIVIPVVLRDCDWHEAPFGKLQALPKDGKAVTLWNDKDTAWRNVSEGIKKRVEELRKKLGHPL